MTWNKDKNNYWKDYGINANTLSSASGKVTKLPKDAKKHPYYPLYLTKDATVYYEVVSGEYLVFGIDDFFVLRSNKSKLPVLTLHLPFSSSVFAHRIVAEAFIPNPEKKPLVLRKDKNYRNLSLDNLCWATYKEMNSLDKKCVYCGKTVRVHRRVLIPVCEKCKLVLKEQKRIDSNQILKQRKDNERKDKRRNYRVKKLPRPNKEMHQKVLDYYFEGKSICEIAKIYGVSRQRISQIVRSYVEC